MPSAVLCSRSVWRQLAALSPDCRTPRCWALVYVGTSALLLQHFLWLSVTLTRPQPPPAPPLGSSVETLLRPQLRVLQTAVDLLALRERGVPPAGTTLVNIPDFSAHCQVYVAPTGNDVTRRGNRSALFNVELFTPFAPPPPPKLPTPTPDYRVYVYQLPAEFNAGRVSCINRKYFRSGCADLTSCGAGVRLGNESSAHLYTHATWQFSLEVLLHHKLLYSPFRTLNASDASLLYVPYYPGLDCICEAEAGAGTRAAGRVSARIARLFKHLRGTGMYPGVHPGRGGAPRSHLMALAKIEREHSTPGCPLLRHPDARNFIFAGIEEEASPAVRRRLFHGAAAAPRPMVVMPYPSYAHLNSFSGIPPPSLSSSRRHVFAFLAAGRRRSNPVRARLLDQFADHATTGSPEQLPGQHPEHLPGQPPGNIPGQLPERDKVWLVTDECRGDHRYHTLQWMARSVFCLQPPGDSPTRKSFYDAVLSGCIPVLLAARARPAPRYPFSALHLRYADFTVTVRGDVRDVTRFLRALPARQVRRMRALVLKAAPALQYSLPIASTPHTDAIKYMLQELHARHLQ